MILHLMTFVLAVLKLMEYIAVSWWVVFAPSIVAVVLFALFLVAAGTMAWYANNR